jgi:hypothetical protein
MFKVYGQSEIAIFEPYTRYTCLQCKCGFFSTMLYAIVSFDATDETDLLPLEWIASDMTVHDILQIAERRQIVSSS